MVVDRPMFMLGTGRSGTTLAFSLVARHSKLAWFSNYDARFQGAVPSGALRTVLRVPWLARQNWLRERRWTLRPMEYYAPLDDAFPGFSTTFRNLEASDVTPWAARRLQRLLADKAAADGLERVFVKWTGWSRAGFMNAIFPDACFVHVHRDGCAVANSLMQRDFWRGWQGPHQWRWGPLPPPQQEIWERNGRSFVVLAGLQWQLVFREIVASLASLPAERVMHVAYEELCRDPVDAVEHVCAFGGLPPDPRLPGLVRATEITEQAIDRWRSDLSTEQADLLQSILADDLAVRDCLS